MIVFRLKPHQISRDLQFHPIYFGKVVEDMSRLYSKDMSYLLKLKCSDLMSFVKFDFLEVRGLSDFLKTNPSYRGLLGFAICKNSKLYFKYYKDESPLFPVGIKGFNDNANQIIINDMSAPLLSHKNNVSSLFLHYYMDLIEAEVLSHLHKRGTFYSRIHFLKALLSCAWIDKNYLRWALNVVHNKYGIRYQDVRLPDGNLVKRVFPIKPMIFRSLSSSVLTSCPWEVEFPEEYKEGSLFIQGGESKDFLNRKSFVEVFPRKIRDEADAFTTVIRAEGFSLVDAEKKAFSKLRHIYNCPAHKWVGYKGVEGGGVCSSCGVFKTNALLPKTVCVECSAPALIYENGGLKYCEAHYFDLPSFKIEGSSLPPPISYGQVNRKLEKIISLGHLKEESYVQRKKLYKHHYKYLVEEYEKSKFSLAESDMASYFPRQAHWLDKILRKSGLSGSQKNILKNFLLNQLIFCFSYRYNLNFNLKEIYQKIKSLKNN